MEQDSGLCPQQPQQQRPPPEQPAALPFPQELPQGTQPERRWAAKRRRPSVADFALSQRSRQNQRGGEDGADAEPHGEQLALVAVEKAEAEPSMGMILSRAVSSVALSMAEQVNASLSEELPSADVSRHFEVAKSSARELVSVAAALEKQEEKKAAAAAVEPSLRSSEDLGNDLSVKSALELSTSHTSFRWLWRLPAALRVQHTSRVLESSTGPKEAALEVCRECLPSLMADPDKAVKWMDRIAACLAWYEVEGPLRPLSHAVGGPGATSIEERQAWRRVDEWDEAFRSLETLLRQGLVSSYAIIADRFTVVVLGEGSAPYTCRRRGETQQPSQREPCAVLYPSFDEFRRMLQENHVPFEIADFDEVHEGGGTMQPGTQAAIEAPAVGEAIVPRAPPTQLMAASAAAQPLRKTISELEDIDDLRECRRDGLKVVTPEESSHGTGPSSSALWFEGSWRVHALLDILRQHFLAAPLAGGPPSPQRLPRLLAPAPFPHAAARSAEVMRTSSVSAPQADMGGGGAATSGEAKISASTVAASGKCHTAELSGCFFPSQVRRLLELLRVLLPSFSCTLTADARRSAGINAFTKLGNFRVETVRCERHRPKPEAPFDWRWEFKLLGA